MSLISEKAEELKAPGGVSEEVIVARTERMLKTEKSSGMQEAEAAALKAAEVASACLQAGAVTIEDVEAMRRHLSNVYRISSVFDLDAVLIASDLGARMLNIIESEFETIDSANLIAESTLVFANFCSATLAEDCDAQMVEATQARLKDLYDHTMRTLTGG